MYVATDKKYEIIQITIIQISDNKINAQFQQGQYFR